MGNQWGARVQDPIRHPEFRRVGARVFNPAYPSLLMIEKMLLNPDTFSTTAEVDETVIRANDVITLVGHLDELVSALDVLRKRR